MMRSINAILSHGAKLFSFRWFTCLATLIAFPAGASITAPLAWNPSADTSVVGYKIYYGVASHGYSNSVDVGNVTNTTITGLSENVTYFFAATTYNASGVESDFSNEATFLANVTIDPLPPAYQPPTLNALSDLSIKGTAGSQTVALTGISPGSSQALTITTASSNPNLIPNPVINYSSPASGGSLTFAPASNANGTATITVTVNNGLSQSNSVTRSFAVNVAADYQPPTLNGLSDVSINENTGSQTVNLTGIGLGSGQALSVTAVSSNPALIPSPSVNYSSPATRGTLTFAPAINANGAATITVTVNNGLAQSNIVTRTFTVNVAAVNQPPTLNSLANITVNYNSAAQTVNLTGISSGASNENQTLKITAASSNIKVVSKASVIYTSPAAAGSLTLTPVANTSGTATITVTVNDGGLSNNITVKTFTITISPKAVAATKPVILNKPANFYTVTSNTVSFSASVAGITPMKYQWKYNGTNISGATSSLLTLKNVTKKQAGQYSVTASNSAGTTNSLVAALVVYPTAAATLSSSANTNGRFSFTVNGVPGFKYAVQASSDFVNWTAVQTNTAPFAFDDANAAQFNQRFYRTVNVP